MLAKIEKKTDSIAAKLKNDINKINSYSEIRQFLMDLPCI